MSLISRTERRYTVDNHESMAYPLVPIGRTIADQVVEDETHRTVRFPYLGWQMVQAKEGLCQVPGTVLYDGYYGLMWLLKESGFPDDGNVWFSRYNFLQAIGWVSNGRNSSGGKLVKPSGRHYRQLRDVCQTLMFTAYLRDLPGRNQGFTVLSSYDLVDDQPGPRGLGEELPRRSRVTFNPELLKRLKDSAQLIKMDLDLYLSLSTGAPRVLFRVLSWMQAQGQERIELESLFNRIGSVQKSYIPSVSRKMLDTAMDELIARNVLVATPEYEKVNDVWHIVFPFGDPERSRSEDEVLLYEAVNCGVAPTRARELLVAHRSRFAQVLAAVASGRYFSDRTNLAGSIVKWTTRPDFELPESSSGLILSNSGDLYRSWIRKRQDDLIAEFGLDTNALSLEVLRFLRTLGEESPEPWLVDGVARMRLSHQFRMPSLLQYSEIVSAGGDPDVLWRAP